MSPAHNPCFFFFNDTATTEIYTLSLHDALPICVETSDIAGRRGADHPADRRRPTGRGEAGGLALRRDLPDRQDHPGDVLSLHLRPLRLLWDVPRDGGGQEGPGAVLHGQGRGGPGGAVRGRGTLSGPEERGGGGPHHPPPALPGLRRRRPLRVA